MKKNRSFGFLLLLLLILSLFAVKNVHAQGSDPTPHDVNAIAKQLYCPVCENTPLDVCETEACKQWRELIRQQLAEGWTEEEIKQYFVENYGARVLSEPPKEGINWLAYVVPPVAIFAGAFILYRSLMAWRESAVPVSSEDAPAPPIPETEEDEYLARIEEELRKRD